MFTKTAFVVCDGVGGNQKGEVASKLFTENFTDLIGNEWRDTEFVKRAVYETQLKLNEIASNNPSEYGMGTTLAALVFDSSNSALAIHIGDSRVYFFPKSTKDTWVSIDHSLVQELVTAGLIAKEETKTHPKRNVITKSIVANNNLEFESPTIDVIENLSIGDYILICSDGVTEVWDDKDLGDLIYNVEIPFEQKFQIIMERCGKYSSDNNTAILVEVSSNIDFHDEEGDNQIESIKLSENLYEINANKDKDNSNANNIRKILNIKGILVIVLIVIIIYLLISLYTNYYFHRHKCICPKHKITIINLN